MCIYTIDTLVYTYGAIADSVQINWEWGRFPRKQFPKNWFKSVVQTTSIHVYKLSCFLLLIRNTKQSYKFEWFLLQKKRIMCQLGVTARLYIKHI